MGFVLLGIVLGLALLFIVLQKEALAAGKIRDAVKRLTGCEAVMGAVQVDLKTNRVSIHRMAIANLPGYQGEKLAEISDIEIEIDIPRYLFKKQAAIPSMKAKIDGLFIERNEKGGLNLGDVEALKFESVKTGAPAGQNFLIEHLELSFDAAELKEFVAGQEEPQTNQVSLKDQKEIYGKIRDPRFLIYAVVIKVLPAFNRGSLGLPRSEIQQALQQMTGNVTAEAGL